MAISRPRWARRLAAGFRRGPVLRHRWLARGRTDSRGPESARRRDASARWPRDEAERSQLRATIEDAELYRVFGVHDLVQGESVLFFATGISDSSLLPGRQAHGSEGNYAFHSHAFP